MRRIHIAIYILCCRLLHLLSTAARNISCIFQIAISKLRGFTFHDHELELEFDLTNKRKFGFLFA